MPHTSIVLSRIYTTNTCLVIQCTTRGNKLISTGRNQLKSSEIKEITRNQGNHEKSRKSREIKEITRNQGNHEKSGKSPEIMEITRNHRKSPEIIAVVYISIFQSFKYR